MSLRQETFGYKAKSGESPRLPLIFKRYQMETILHLLNIVPTPINLNYEISYASLGYLIVKTTPYLCAPSNSDCREAKFRVSETSSFAHSFFGEDLVLILKLKFF